jgi:hypothetical protein
MNEKERQQLAEKLAAMTYDKARKEVKRLDPDADLKLWRTSVNDSEYHTTYDCPNLEARVILVEEMREFDKHGKVMAEYYYVEARVVEKLFA